MDDSFYDSPEKAHSSRFLSNERKIKIQSESQQKPSILEDLYYDEDNKRNLKSSEYNLRIKYKRNEILKNDSIVSNAGYYDFKPRHETCLQNASGSFVNCSILELSDNTLNDIDVTESELMTICEAADELILKESLVGLKSPPHELEDINITTLTSERNIEDNISVGCTTPNSISKSIVDVIFEDFCSSSPEPDSRCTVNNSPPYIFNNQRNLRTYEKRKTKHKLNEFSKRTNNDQKLKNKKEKIINADKDHYYVSIDEASIHSTNESQSLCDNLMNLSNYFGVSEEHEISEVNLARPLNTVTTISSPVLSSSNDSYYTPTSKFEKNNDVINSLIKEIQEIRKEFPIIRPTNANNSISSDISEITGFDIIQDNMDNVMVEGIQQSNNGNITSEKSCETNCWYDDGFFLNYCTMDLISDKGEMKKTQSIELHNSQQPSTSRKCFLVTKEELVPLENSSSCISQASTLTGFKTASNKNIPLTESAQIKAQQILTNLPDIPNNKDDLKRSVKENYTSVKSNQIASNPNSIVGFKTASNKHILLTEKAKLLAANILENLPEFPNYSNNNSKTLRKPDYPKEQINNWSLDQNIIKTEESVAHVAFKEELELSKAPGNNTKLYEDESCNKIPTIIGFKTASNKMIPMSKEAQLKAARIFENLPELTSNSNKIKEDYPLGNNISLEANNIIAKTSISENITRKSDGVINDEWTNIELSEWLLDDYKEPYLQKEKKIKIEEKVLNKTNEIGEKEINDIFDYDDDNDVLQSQHKFQIDNSSKSDDNYLSGEEFFGFDNPQNPNIDKANHQLNTVLDYFANNLKSIKMENELQEGNKGVLDNVIENKMDEKILKCEELEEKMYENIKLSEWPLEIINIETKNSEIKVESDHMPFDCSTPVNTKRLYEFNVNKSNIVKDLSSCTPLLPFSSQSIISRKNLLSLNKRRKMTKSFNITNNNNIYSIPNVNLADQRNESAKTSSVQQISSKVGCVEKSYSLHNNRTCSQILDSPCENIFYSTKCPTPKQRIERLTMYGESPPLAPLPLMNNCRTLGLRRPNSRKHESKST